MNILSTERLSLREFEVSDAEVFFNLNNDLEVIKYTGDFPFKDLAEAKRFLETYEYKKFGYGRWAVILKESNELIGWCGLRRDELMAHTDLGFRFFRKHWGKGYATEAGKACIEYGFDKYKLDRIVGKAMLLNTQSIKVLEKCGMRFVEEREFECHAGALYEILPKT
ncbi:MAG: GNAT family N-acetyltransferase [Bacteroidia bacterium]|nr:GNAT family N-acetyltransferase [Bacteroidia bacterium]